MFDKLEAAVVIREGLVKLVTQKEARGQIQSFTEICYLVVVEKAPKATWVTAKFEELGSNPATAGFGLRVVVKDSDIGNQLPASDEIIIDSAQAPEVMLAEIAYIV